MRFGPGKYEVTVNVPEITDERRDYFRFYSVAEFTVINTAKEDKRYLLPSRGIQSDSRRDQGAGQEADRRGRRAIGAKPRRSTISWRQEHHLRCAKIPERRVRPGRQRPENPGNRKREFARTTPSSPSPSCASIGMEARFVEGIADGIRHAWVEVKVDGRVADHGSHLGFGLPAPERMVCEKVQSRNTSILPPPNSGKPTPAPV